MTDLRVRRNLNSRELINLSYPGLAFGLASCCVTYCKALVM